MYTIDDLGMASFVKMICSTSGPSSATFTPSIILNSSAIGAAIQGNGDKMIFFQDAQQNLRRVVSSGNAWVALDALPAGFAGFVGNNTPLALYMESSVVCLWPRIRE